MGATATCTPTIMADAWEPQFDLGFMGGSAWGGDWMRMGLGFNLGTAAATSRSMGTNGWCKYFEVFQQQLSSAWSGTWLTGCRSPEGSSSMETGDQPSTCFRRKPSSG